jgi:hypothetical protein
VLDAWSSDDTVGTQWPIWEVGASRRSLGHWGCALDGDWGILASSSSSCFLPTLYCALPDTASRMPAEPQSCLEPGQPMCPAKYIQLSL